MNVDVDKDIDKNQYSDTEDKYDDASADLPSEVQISSKYKGESVQKTSRTKRKLKTKEYVADRKNIEHKVDTEPKNCELCRYFYVIGNETYVVHAQEPWPKDVKLFQPYEVEQILLPDNANCLAVQAFLKMCNLDFQIESRPNAEFMSPTGKVPFIKCGAFLVAELEGIVTFVGQKGISLTEHLDPEQKADLRAYIALINNVLGSAENYVCWCDRETYREVTKPRNGSVYPWPLNLIQTWSKRSKQIKALKTLGWYDKTLEEVFQEVETCCQALTDRLENNVYFFGNKFTELDALLYGHVYTLLTTYLPAANNHFSKIIQKFHKLVNHCKRIDIQVMGRDTDSIQYDWSQSSKADLNKRTKLCDEDKDNDKLDVTPELDAIGDIGRETDWFVIDKKFDTENVGDTIPAHD